MKRSATRRRRYSRSVGRLLGWDLLSAGRGRAALLESARPGLDLVGDLVRRTLATGALRAGADPELFNTALVALALGYSLQQPALEALRAQSGVSHTDEDFVEYACCLLLEPHPGRHGSPRRGRAR